MLLEKVYKPRETRSHIYIQRVYYIICLNVVSETMVHKSNATFQLENNNNNTANDWRLRNFINNVRYECDENQDYDSSVHVFFRTINSMLRLKEHISIFCPRLLLYMSLCRQSFLWWRNYASFTRWGRSVSRIYTKQGSTNDFRYLSPFIMRERHSLSMLPQFIASKSGDSSCLTSGPVNVIHSAIKSLQLSCLLHGKP